MYSLYTVLEEVVIYWSPCPKIIVRMRDNSRKALVVNHWKCKRAHRCSSFRFFSSFTRGSCSRLCREQCLRISFSHLRPLQWFAKNMLLSICNPNTVPGFPYSLTRTVRTWSQHQGKQRKVAERMGAKAGLWLEGGGETRGAPGSRDPLGLRPECAFYSPSYRNEQIHCIC